MSKKVRRSAVTQHLIKRGVGTMVRQIAEHKLDGVAVHSVWVNDGYVARRYNFQRKLFYSTASIMNWYLARRPGMSFEHDGNLVRKFLYRLPSFSKWAELMDSQGSLAMEPLHNPEVRRLATGHRLGPVTRRLFRHGADPRGIRTRTVLAGWLANKYVDSQKVTAGIKWLSLAGGSAVHAMHMIDASAANKPELKYTNIDIHPMAIELAEIQADLAGLKPENVQMFVGDVFDEQLIGEAGYSSGVDIIDMMGILEYLDDKQAARLLKVGYKILKPDGIILTCNMRKSHPQLNLHKRGVGWPGVLPRSTKELLKVCENCGIGADEIYVYQPHDGVYNVLRIIKKKK